MRTTVEILDRQRAKLLELAAQRGEKGFSNLVQEAIDHYLRGLDSTRSKIDAALSVMGTLGDEEADHLEKTVRRIRSSWR